MIYKLINLVKSFVVAFVMSAILEFILFNIYGLDNIEVFKYILVASTIIGTCINYSIYTSEISVYIDQDALNNNEEEKDN